MKFCIALSIFVAVILAVTLVDATARLPSPCANNPNHPHCFKRVVRSSIKLPARCFVNPNLPGCPSRLFRKRSAEPLAKLPLPCARNPDHPHCG